MKLSREKKYLMLTVLLIALFQMPHLALTPAIDKIRSSVFPDRTLAQVQEAFALTNFVIPIVSIISAFAVNRGGMTKRSSVVLGLCLLTVTGALATVLNTQFWHIRLLSVCLGASLGFLISNAMGIMFDSFAPAERQIIAGYQTSCINAGGIMMSLVGGALTSFVWFGGYFVLFAGVFIAAFALLHLPKRPRLTRAASGAPRARLPLPVFGYSLVIGVFMMLHTVCGNNISTHLTQAGASDPALAGVAVACAMGGGVVSGLLFGRLSARFEDYLLAIGAVTLVIGFGLLGFFAQSVPAAFIAVFIAGMSMSCIVPQCMFAISALCVESNSATATALSNSVCPSLGGFISPYVFTRLTTFLFGESTGKRYLFTAGAALIFAAALFCAAASGRRKRARA